MDRRNTRSILAILARGWWVVMLVLGVVMLADVFYTATRQPTYLARATLIIGPSPNVERSSVVYSVDSLGRGRIVGTYAEVLGSEVVHREAVERLGYSADVLNRGIIFRSSTVSDTAVIQVTAETADPESSAAAANAVGEVGIERMAALYPVYNLSFLTQAGPPLQPFRPDPMRNYSLGLLFGLPLGLVAAYLFDLMRQRGARLPSLARHESRNPQPEPRPAPRVQATPMEPAAAAGIAAAVATASADGNHYADSRSGRESRWEPSGQAESAASGRWAAPAQEELAAEAYQPEPIRAWTHAEAPSHEAAESPVAQSPGTVRGDLPSYQENGAMHFDESAEFTAEEQHSVHENGASLNGKILEAASESPVELSEDSYESAPIQQEVAQVEPTPPQPASVPNDFNDLEARLLAIQNRPGGSPDAR